MQALLVRRSDDSLEYVVSFPPAYVPGTGAWPVLCFLHGGGESVNHHQSGVLQPIREALTLHGPLQTGSSPQATDRFIVVAPQLPDRGGDIWEKYTEAVKEIVKEVQKAYSGNYRGQTYLTGFSYGGNGVFRIASAQPDFWTALWSVDPPGPLPGVNPGCPVWLSLRPSSLDRLKQFPGVQFVLATSNPNGDFLYTNKNLTHVDVARDAYQDNQIYDWLLTKHRS